MSRRDTIIIAVLVNAALLVVLFVSAITSKNEISEREIISKALEETTIDAKELFSDAKEEVLKTEVATKEVQNEFVALEQNENKVEKQIENIEKEIKHEEKIVYKLPSLVKEEKFEKAEEKKLDFFTVLVKKGDSLDKIAKVNKVRISDISKLNNLNSSLLKIGQKLRVPKNDINQNIASNKEPLKNVATKENKVVSKKESFEFYIVKVGDNPYTIAMKYHLKPNALLKLNNLDEKKARKLKPGDKLRIR